MGEEGEGDIGDGEEGEGEGEEAVAAAFLIISCLIKDGFPPSGTFGRDFCTVIGEEESGEGSGEEEERAEERGDE